MAEPVAPSSLATSGRARALVAVVVVLIVAAGVVWWTTRGRETTDDAQLDGHVTPMAARIGGTVLRVPVTDNQLVDAGAVLVELDPRDYQLALDRARADLADAEAGAVAAQSGVPIAATTTDSGERAAQGGVEQARRAVEVASREAEAARARLTAVQARLREADANATRSRRDVERLKGLLAKDEIAQQQFDAAVAAADAQTAAADAVRAQVTEAEAAIRAADSRQAQAAALETQARAALRSAQTGPEQVTATRARATSAQARVAQARAAVALAELTLEHTVVKAPARGIVSRKGVLPGQVIQPGQALLALVGVDDLWVTANFKETQLSAMRPGQTVSVTVDALGGRALTGTVDSIAGATGARFSLMPPENATGNFVKVVQRVPVKIALDAGQDPDHRLRPGLSVTPTVSVR